jgi:tetratricopeptide (TPR) repeat protein
MGPAASSRKSAERTALIHRELVQLVALVGMAVLAFLVTRAVAMNNRSLSVRNAAEWYRRGEQLLDAGRTDAAIEAFRRATVRNRTNRTYLLALSRALASKRDYDAARTILLSIRDLTPEDAAINLDLARLSAARQDVTEALRFYHDALYAPWPAASAEQRRGVRIELIRFLLTHGQAGRAQSELLAAGADLPDDAPHHVELAELLSQAGDNRNALEQFQRALRVAPDDRAALIGAGRAAFEIGDYVLARRYLHQVPENVEAVRRVRDVADQVVSRDPIAARIGGPERRRRLDADLSYARDRMLRCIAQRGGEPSSEEQLVQNDLQAFGRRLQRSVPLDQDTIELGMDLIDRAERAAVESCGPATVADQALLLIARQHGASSQ